MITLAAILQLIIRARISNVTAPGLTSASRTSCSFKNDSL
jgi:hypothetical protein